MVDLVIRAKLAVGIFAGVDSTPNAFSFVDQTDVALSSTITSAAVTISGIDIPASISITGGFYDINGSGAFTNAPGAVNNGNTVRARHTSSGSNITATNTVVTIGGVSDTFTSTTLPDTTPAAFSFVDQSGVTVNSTITSAAITISGLSVGTSITLSASGGTIDKNANGSFLSSQTVANGDTVRARVTSSASNSTATNCTVTASPSGVQDTFTATTAAAVGSGSHGQAFTISGSGFGTNALNYGFTGGSGGMIGWPGPGE